MLPVEIVLTDPKSCTLSPPTTTHCTGTGRVTTDKSGLIYVTATYDASHLAVSYYCSTPALTTNNCNPTGWQDNVFHLTATYVKQTCDVGSYSILFTAKQGTDYSYDTFTVYVHCPFLGVQ